MSSFRIQGGCRLEGDLCAGTAKNAILPIMAACILSSGEMCLRSAPRLSDVQNMIEILRTLGVRVEWKGEDIFLCAAGAAGHEMPEGISKQIRSSIFMLGPILARHGQATFTYPGGCEIGLRPIDLHLSGLRALGAEIREENGMIYCSGKLRGCAIHLDYPSVGATENIMMAAATASGETVITNAAREPEIEDLARFLGAMGARVHGAGGDTIAIQGVAFLHGADYTPMADRIIVGTLLCAAAMTRGDVLVRDGREEDMRAVLAKLRETGCRVDAGADGIRLSASRRLRSVRALDTAPFPGFPTDMQAQMMALLTVCEGTSAIRENVFENRFGHVAELRRMGADIAVHDRLALVRGVGGLMGATVCSKDLRGGAALVLAGLRAQGETIVENVQYIDRGYPRLEDMLRALGANVERMTDA